MAITLTHLLVFVIMIFDLIYIGKQVAFYFYSQGQWTNFIGWMQWIGQIVIMFDHQTNDLIDQ